MKDAIPDRIAFHYYKETAIAATFRNNVAMTLYRARARLELVKNRHFVRRQRDEFRESIDECIGNRRRRRRTSHFRLLFAFGFCILLARYGAGCGKSNSLARTTPRLGKNDPVQRYCVRATY